MVYLIKIWLSDSFSYNNDAIVYLDAATDPYSAATTGAAGAWSQEAQTTLTNVIGEANYDIGHCLGLPVEVEMLDASAACVHLLNIPLGCYTSPADGVPQGDTLILILLCMK
jgi:hypothetical protein